MGAVIIGRYRWAIQVAAMLLVLAACGGGGGGGGGGSTSSEEKLAQAEKSWDSFVIDMQVLQCERWVEKTGGSAYSPTQPAKEALGFVGDEDNDDYEAFMESHCSFMDGVGDADWDE